MTEPFTHVLAAGLLLGPAAAAAVTDLATFRIPNALSLLLLAGFPVAVLATGAGDFDWGSHLAGGAVALAVGLAAFVCSVMGGGDAKLMAALGLWAGTDRLLPLVMVIALAGGALAVALLALRRLALPVPLRLLDDDGPVPYAVAIAFGALWLAATGWPG